MRLKKYVGKTSKEAIARMRIELGDDASIVSSRTIPHADSPTGQLVEITATIEEEIPSKELSPMHDTASPFLDSLSNNSTDILGIGNTDTTPNTSSEERAASALSKLTDMVKEEEQKQQRAVKFKTLTTPLTSRTAQTTAPSVPPTQESSIINELRGEIHALKDMVRSVASDIRYKNTASFNNICKEIFEMLVEAEIRESLALEAIGTAVANGKDTSMEEAVASVRSFLFGDISIGSPITQRTHKCTVMAFVGATGVGKTTTLAKLATIAQVVNKANILIISADTYRVGGAEQLQTISAIANMPFQVVYSSQELRQIINRELPKRDYIFIDTVGRSPNNQVHLQEIRSFLEAAQPKATFLVQTATTSESSLRQGYKKFATLSPTHLVVTKMDEAVTVGSVVGALQDCPLPLAYFGVGQSIPDDIEAASRSLLADTLFSSVQHVSPQASALALTPKRQSTAV